MKQSLLARVFFWSLERFPPIQFLSAFLTFSITCLPLNKNVQLRFLLIGSGIVYFFLLLLRILDEHKDYNQDLLAHPERRLQKGLVSLKDLRIFAVIAFICWIFLMSQFQMSWEVGVSLLALIAWIGLMTYEFFCPDWIRQRVILYSISHLFVSPLLILFCASLAGTYKSSDFFWMAGVSFFSAFSYEVARKMKGQNEENKLEVNYSNAYGYRMPIFIFILVNFLGTICSWQLTEVTRVSIYIHLIGFIYTIFTAFFYFWKPLKISRKMNEASSASLSVINFLLPLWRLLY